MDLEDDAVAWSRVDPAGWADGFNDMFALVAGEFAQAPSRLRARAYLLGLLSQTERKNGWWLADFAGDATPDGMQRLLNFYCWSADAVRDVLRDYVIAGIGDAGAVLVIDETGFLKKGRMSAGVQRQYTGTAGRIENCQVGVFLAYAAPGGGRALIDRELYLPQESWCADRHRQRQPSPAGPPQPHPERQGRAGAGVLHLPRPGRDHAGRTGRRGRRPVGGRVLLPGRQERD